MSRSTVSHRLADSMGYREVYEQGLERIRSIGMEPYLDLGAETHSQNRLNRQHIDSFVFEMRMLDSQQADWFMAPNGPPFARLQIISLGMTPAVPGGSRAIRKLGRCGCFRFPTASSRAASGAADEMASSIHSDVECNPRALFGAVNDNHEASGYLCAPAARGCRRSELGSGEKDLSCLQIECERVRSLQRFQILRHAVTVRGVLVDDRHGTAIRVEY